jgi:hypothetical protein
MALIHNTQVQDVISTGTINAEGEYVEITYEGRQSAGVVITGVWEGVLVLEGSCDDGSTWVTCWLSSINTDHIYAGIPVPYDNITANGTYKVFNAGGMTHYRLRATDWTSGEAAVTMSAVYSPPTFTYVSGSVIQQVMSDVNNSSTDSINQNAIWEGQSTSTLGVAGIQVNINADQNCEVYVDQSMDGENWNITDTFKYYYTHGGDSWTVQATASFVRVRVKNVGFDDAVDVMIQTALCPMVEAVPRSLSEKGNLKVAVNEIVGYLGESVEISPQGNLRVCTPVRLVGAVFIGTTFDTNFWTKGTPTGSGDATLASGIMTLKTGGTANSSVTVNSIRIGRYVGGAANFFRGNIIVPAKIETGGTGNVRRWGAFDTSDGYFFEFDGTDLKVVCRKGGSDAESVTSGSFNGFYGERYVLDTNMHTFEIYWTTKHTWFVIDEEVIHEFTATTAALSNTPSLKIGLENTNSGGNTANNTLLVCSATINRLGTMDTTPHWYHVATNETRILKYGPGTLHRVMVNTFGSTGNTCSVHDDTVVSGTANTIAVIDLNKNNAASNSYEYHIPFHNGLKYITNSSVDMTIVYE